MRTALIRFLMGMVCIWVVCGCATFYVPTTNQMPPCPPAGIVLVADGAGGYPEAARAAISAAREAGVSVSIRSFEWTHGRGRGVADMTDVEHARAQGQRFAATITSYRQSYPNTPIYVLAYSAGCHVALEATRWLEPNILERIVLLAPAVSADYDLRPALAVSRQGVDAFTSKRDRLFLGMGPRLVGTADGKRHEPASGRVGFDMPPGNDPLFASRLQQHPWSHRDSWTGNHGGHSGSLRPAYFRTSVLPLLTPAASGAIR